MSSQQPSRSQSVAPGGAYEAPGGEPDAAPSRSDGIDRRRHPRIRVDTAGAETVASAIRAAERKPSGERRASGNLRDNVGWTVARDGGRRIGDRPRLRLKRSRIFVLGIAVVAGGIAAYLASQVGRPAAPAATAAAPKATAEVLVASRQIAVGQRLSAGTLTWAAWPENALQSGFITAATTPDAMSEVDGLMARAEFLPGDPIRKEKLVKGSGSFLSASLDKGMRGVSVAVSAELASGGFISPNDHVDVVLTRTPPAGSIGGNAPRSQTILHNVLVLAINSRSAASPGGDKSNGELQNGTFSGQAIATLALDAADADLVISASALGKLSLLLRPAVGPSQSDMAAKAEASANQAIRLTSPFWQQ